MSKGLRIFRRSFVAMGSPCEVQFYVQHLSHGRLLADRAVSEVQRLELRYSRYRKDSFLSRINETAMSGGRIEVDPETSGILDYVSLCHEQSAGLFDVTSGILRKAWRFQEQCLPDPEQLEALLLMVGWDRISWQSPFLSFPNPGMEIDLGGAVKEYAVDRVSGIFWAAGIRHGLVNLGGDIRVIGPHPDGSGWQVGISHPREKGRLMGTIELFQGAMASSGDYERCMVIDGIRYGHILNPKTGWPCNYMASVSVMGDFCMVAGSASTIGMLKENEGPDWLLGLGLPCFWMDVAGGFGGTQPFNQSLEFSVERELFSDKVVWK